MGHAYVEQQKYAEAEAAFQKQIEVNPLDRYATASLGSLYLERRQYESAVSQFQKAITMRPDDAWLQAQLGKAHLNLKQEAAAVAAFDRAVELSPTPTMWNDIAYEFALKGVHLDRALQYAESAVSSATAASRNLDIMRADDKALDVVRSLSAYWDTLGWVYFARGDAARAERLVEAAWLLDQHAEVGDHLAQIYQKLGRSEDAIRTYALAVAADRPSDEIRQRLVNIAGERKTEFLVETHRPELTKSRTVAIPGTGPSGKSADFLVLFSSPAVVENVRFVGGDEALRPLGDLIRKAAFKRMFPDDQQAKILRRGVLACGAASCDFTLLPPGDTRPVK